MRRQDWRCQRAQPVSQCRARGQGDRSEPAAVRILKDAATHGPLYLKDNVIDIMISDWKQSSQEKKMIFSNDPAEAAALFSYAALRGLELLAAVSHGSRRGLLSPARCARFSDQQPALLQCQGEPDVQSKARRLA